MPAAEMKQTDLPVRKHKRPSNERIPPARADCLFVALARELVELAIYTIEGSPKPVV